MRCWVNVLFWGLLVAVIGQVVWYHGLLPARVATHFDASGRANGWMSREAHTGLQIGLMLGLAGLFQLLAWLNDRLPVEFINVPNRDYWFAGERRVESLRWLRALLLLLGAGMFVVLGAVFGAVDRANLTAEPRLSGGLWVVNLVSVVVIGGTVVAILRRFRRPPNSV